jgi:hypothetical protein
MSIEAMKQALEALETPLHAQPLGLKQNAIVAIRTAIERAEKQEPRQWVGLTDDDIDNLELPPSGTATVRDFVRLIETKLKAKNEAP